MNTFQKLIKVGIFLTIVYFDWQLMFSQDLSAVVLKDWISFVTILLGSGWLIQNWEKFNPNSN